MQEDMGLGRSVFFFFFFSIYLLLLLLLLCSHDGFPFVNAAEQATYYLGFLSPFPDLKEDALIPSGLSQQWQSAFQAALEVLNSENRSYQIEAIIEDSSCNWMKVSSVAHRINQTNLIGIVGPACSGAALSAIQYLDPQIPIVSFAATHESLSNKSRFPNFFRTVYGDSYQTLAMLSLMEKLDIRNATILCVKDYYSLNLASSIQTVAAARVSGIKLLDGGHNSTINTDQLHEVLDTLSPNDVIILSVPPLVAQDIWKAALPAGLKSSPWWYLGTDGVTAFNPSLDGSLDLVEALEGEIGLAPNVGNSSDNPNCQKFYEHWRDKDYPGLPVTSLSNSRSYVTHLIDTVTLYFKIVDALVSRNASVNSSAVLSALQGNGVGLPHFIGCTGNVEIDPLTGSRKISSDQPSVYDLVGLENGSWELRGRISNTVLVSSQLVAWPPSPAPRKKHHKGLIAGLVLSFVSLIVLVTIVAHYYRRKNQQLVRFVPIRS